jgi:hypothetical protein
MSRNRRELAYVAWLAAQRGISIEAAIIEAIRPRPRIYEIKRAPVVHRWGNVVRLRPLVRRSVGNG